MISVLLIVAILSLLNIIVHGSNFKEVMEDERVFMVEFYSGMCGSCREFSPTWTKLENVAKNIATTKVNIDEPDGMEFAKKLGVLEEGQVLREAEAALLLEALVEGRDVPQRVDDRLDELRAFFESHFSDP